MRDAFESWMGQEVVVRLGFGRISVSLRGVLLRDLRDSLLLKPEAGPNIEIEKARILAIEEVERGLGLASICFQDPAALQTPGRIVTD